jgi:hypothetical protein
MLYKDKKEEEIRSGRNFLFLNYFLIIKKLFISYELFCQLLHLFHLLIVNLRVKEERPVVPPRTLLRRNANGEGLGGQCRDNSGVRDLLNLGDRRLCSSTGKVGTRLRPRPCGCGG